MPNMSSIIPDCCGYFIVNNVDYFNINIVWILQLVLKWSCSTIPKLSPPNKPPMLFAGNAPLPQFPYSLRIKNMAPLLTLSCPPPQVTLNWFSLKTVLDEEDKHRWNLLLSQEVLLWPSNLHQQTPFSDWSLRCEGILHPIRVSDQCGDC